MATGRVFSVFLPDLATALLSERETAPRAQIIAHHVFQLLPNTAVLVYVIEGQEPLAWKLKALAGNVTLDKTELPIETGALGTLNRQRKILQFAAAELSREDYAHLDIRQSISGLTYIPIATRDQLIGCIELVSFTTPVSPEFLQGLQSLTECCARGLGTASAYESERNATLRSVTRLTQLYDIEKVFSGSLDMEGLWSLICSKVLDLNNATGVNLWMVDTDGQLLLVQKAGSDTSYSVGATQKDGDGVAGQVSKTGEPILVPGDDPSLSERNKQMADVRITSVMAAPLMDGEHLVGVLEVLKCDAALEFDEDELFTLVQIAGSAAQALHNASLLEAERKVEILHTLVNVSQEIASTLNLDRVLQAIVNQPQRVIPYDRAAIALEDRGALRIKAVSGISQLNPSDPDIQRLENILRWAFGLQQEIMVRRHGEEIEDPRPETREKFRNYFDQTNVGGFHAVPLTDEEGRLGILSFEGTDPDFITGTHLEMIKVIANQATVALRNASLYKEVPFIGVLEPLLDKKRKFLALEKRRRAMFVSAVIAVLLFFIFVPIPMRVDGDAQIAPTRTDYVRADTDGILETVFVREGDHVQRGTVLAQMQDWEQRTDLARTHARRNAAIEDMNRALAMSDGGLAGRKRVDAEYWAAEVAHAEGKLGATKLRAGIDGVVVTPHVENMAGKKLTAGSPVMELVDTSKVTVDVAITQRDISLVHAGESARVKLQSFSTKTFPGRVLIVSPRGAVEDDGRVFYARVLVRNDDGAIRSGMLGRGKISVGWHPTGYVLFRDLGMWLWSKSWGWFGW